MRKYKIPSPFACQLYEENYIRTTWVPNESGDDDTGDEDDDGVETLIERILFPRLAV